MGEKTSKNPMAQFHKREKEKEKRKTKAERSKNLEEKIMRKSSNEVEAEIKAFKVKGAEFVASSHKLQAYESTYKKLKPTIKDREESGQTKAPNALIHSIFYDEFQNPSATPPTGQTQRYYHPDGSIHNFPPSSIPEKSQVVQPIIPKTQNSSQESEDSEDSAPEFLANIQKSKSPNPKQVTQHPPPRPIIREIPVLPNFQENFTPYHPGPQRYFPPGNIQHQPPQPPPNNLRDFTFYPKKQGQQGMHPLAQQSQPAQSKSEIRAEPQINKPEKEEHPPPQNFKLFVPNQLRRKK